MMSDFLWHVSDLRAWEWALLVLCILSVFVIIVWGKRELRILETPPKFLLGRYDVIVLADEDELADVVEAEDLEVKRRQRLDAAIENPIGAIRRNGIVLPMPRSRRTH